MPTRKMKLVMLSCVGLLAVSVITNLCGCESSGKTASGPDAGQATASDVAPTKGGAQLWAETCEQCHNLRPSTNFSDHEWDLIVEHMRLRANLIGQEQREITKFLQAAN